MATHLVINTKFSFRVKLFLTTEKIR